MEKYISEVILAQDSQCISYKKYMELALYHPTSGYYSRPVKKIGKQGDFYTSSNVGEVFGRALGRLFIHLFEKYDIQPNIIELGGGTGRMARTIMRFIQENNRAMFLRLSYIIVESSPYHQAVQQEELTDYNNIRFIDSLEQVKELSGMVFSNEFFDAFPVHVIERKNDTLYEVKVTVENGRLIENLKLLQNERILSYLEHQSFPVKEGQRLEVPLSMQTYYESLCDKMQKGFLLTIDYGYTNKEWENIEHIRGSIRGYRKHQMVRNVLVNPGEIDITTHIHWDTLINGPLQTVSFLPQSEFLVQCGLLDDLKQSIHPDPFSFEHKRNRAIRTLLQPGQISSYFQALMQVKNLECSTADIFPIHS